jgi:hypothetical protein
MLTIASPLAPPLSTHIRKPGSMQLPPTAMATATTTQRSPPSNLPPLHPSPPALSTASSGQTDRITGASPASAPAYGPPYTSSSRFIGDMNPEAVFVEAADSARPPDTEPEAAAAKNGHLGIWFSGSACSGVGSVHRASHSIPLVQRLLASVIDSECLSCVPPADDYARLKETFVNKIYPIFPLIPLSMLANDREATDAAVLTRQLVSLAASADPHMAPYLHLHNPHPAPPLPSAEFASAIASAIRALLETDRISDRLLRIRSYLTLSLYLQPSSPAQADLPSQLAARAIHDVHTLGLQVMRFDEGEGSDDLETLFCLAFAIDRLNAAMYGRPVLMHERDFGCDMSSCISRREPCFRLLLLVVQWLDQVICLYRANSPVSEQADTAAFVDLPVLEEMIIEADALRETGPLIGESSCRRAENGHPTNGLGTIEILYHAIIILSCRLSRPSVHGSEILPPPPASANARRSLAAERISTAVSSPREGLSPVPFVPYAVSLALSVEYRKMRHSRLPMFRTRAKDAFARHCELLAVFGGFFWGARVVSGLGARMLREMERAAGAKALEELAAGGGRTAAATPAAQRADVDVDAQARAGPAPQGGNMSGDRDGAGGGLGDEGVFGHFNPPFDLTAVDQAIEANLDITIGQPLNWVDWEGLFNSPSVGNG